MARFPLVMLEECLGSSFKYQLTRGGDLYRGKNCKTYRPSLSASAITLSTLSSGWVLYVRRWSAFELSISENANTPLSFALRQKCSREVSYQWESFVVRPLGGFWFQASFDWCLFLTHSDVKQCYWLLVTPDQFGHSDD